MICEYCDDSIPEERHEEFKLLEKFSNGDEFLIRVCSQGCLERYLEDSPTSVRHKFMEGGKEVA